MRWSRPGVVNAVLHESALTLLPAHYTPCQESALTSSRARRSRRSATRAQPDRAVARDADASRRPVATRVARPAVALAPTRRMRDPASPGRPGRLALCETSPVFEARSLVRRARRRDVRRVAELRCGAVGAAAAGPRGRPDAHADRGDPPRPQPDAASAAPRATSRSSLAWLTRRDVRAVPGVTRGRPSGDRGRPAMTAHGRAGRRPSSTATRRSSASRSTASSRRRRRCSAAARRPTTGRRRTRTSARSASACRGRSRSSTGARWSS